MKRNEGRGEGDHKAGSPGASKSKRQPTRSLFDELLAGVREMGEHRRGKVTLRTRRIQVAPLPGMDGKQIRAIRERMNVSRGVFARLLRVNVRTLERWEQGRGKPNDQAVALILMVERFPDTLRRLESLACAV